MAHWDHRPSPAGNSSASTNPMPKGSPASRPRCSARPISIRPRSGSGAPCKPWRSSRYSRTPSACSERRPGDGLRRPPEDWGRRGAADSRRRHPPRRHGRRRISELLRHGDQPHRLRLARGAAHRGRTAASFDILWCPHQDHYGAFDCRVQRYFVQGMIDAAGAAAGLTEEEGRNYFQVFFTSTIPAGAKTCCFQLRRGTPKSDRSGKPTRRSSRGRPSTSRPESGVQSESPVRRHSGWYHAGLGGLLGSRSSGKNSHPGYTVVNGQIFEPGGRTLILRGSITPTITSFPVRMESGSRLGRAPKISRRWPPGATIRFACCSPGRRSSRCRGSTMRPSSITWRCGSIGRRRRASG